MKLLIALLAVLSITFTGSLSAQSKVASVLCLSRSQQINVRSKCQPKEARLSGRNLGALGFNSVFGNSQSSNVVGFDNNDISTGGFPVFNFNSPGGVNNSSGGSSSFNANSSSSANSSFSSFSSFSSIGSFGSTSSNGRSFNIDFESCYTTTTRRSESSVGGRLAVGVMCSENSDLLLNDQFYITTSSSVKPTVESKQLVINQIPNGVAYSFVDPSGSNRPFNIEVSAVCCPITN